ncbi:Glutaredoxin [Gnomoniopsis sp. IMI 355080]|nr:Glutaredoxin [Gnomoniopsis sp. IMI 355080]
MEAVKADLVKQIKENEVVVWAKYKCPFCDMTRTRLDGLGAKYKWIDLINDDLGGFKAQDIQACFDTEDFFGKEAGSNEGLKVTKPQRTVPNIWIGQEQIGGYDDLKGLSDEDIKEKLKAAAS